MGARRPPLRIARILAWARAHRARTGAWPHADTGPIPEAPGLTWGAVNAALYYGTRGLPGGSSLARLLTRDRGGPPRKPLTVEQILAWAEEHRRRTGGWPSATSGAVAAAPGEDWKAINSALVLGLRGLPGDDSLARLLRRTLAADDGHLARS